jgi:hypothetical protein
MKGEKRSRGRRESGNEKERGTKGGGAEEVEMLQFEKAHNLEVSTVAGRFVVQL